MKSLFKLIKSFKSLKLFKLIRPISRIRPIRLIRLIRPISLIRPIKFLKPARYKFITACLVLSLALGGLFFTASPAHAGWFSWLNTPVVFVKKAIAAIGNITGEGTISFLPLFTGADNPSNTIGDSIVYDDGAGHVGIGTGAVSLTKRLTVKQLSDSQTTGAGLSVMNTAGTGYTQLITGADNNSYLFNGAGGSYIMLTSAENVGIGTGPTRKLDIVSSVNSSSQTALAVDNIDFKILASNPAGVNKGLYWHSVGATGGNTLYSYMYREQSTGKLFIGSQGAGTILETANGGNVGIGTTNPTAKLHVKGDIKLDENSDDKIDFGWGTEVWRRSSNGALVLDAQNDIIEMNGNVGIGTAAPGYKLDVAGTANVSVAQITANYPLLRMAHTPGAVNMKNFQIQNHGTTLYFGSNNDDWSWKVSDILTLNENGDVGIGSLLRIGRANDPSAKLHVKGSMILEPQATDPVGPVNGQMWMRQ